MKSNVASKWILMGTPPHNREEQLGVWRGVMASGRFISSTFKH